jgi:hypothetical protein
VATPSASERQYQQAWPPPSDGCPSGRGVGEERAVAVAQDHELLAALEQVQERDRAVGSDDLDRPVELHLRHPAADRGDGIALAGVGLLADQKLVTGGLPGG